VGERFESKLDMEEWRSPVSFGTLTTDGITKKPNNAKVQSLTMHHTQVGGIRIFLKLAVVQILYKYTVVIDS